MCKEGLNRDQDEDEEKKDKKMAYKDIADHLGKNLSTIKSQIRKKLIVFVSCWNSGAINGPIWDCNRNG